MDVTLALDVDHDERLRLNGTKAGGYGQEPRTYAEGRVCQVQGCSTVLSRYNRQTLCWQHEPRHEYVGPLRGRRPAEVHVIRDLAALIA